jgi:hypothetical protein
MLTPPATLHDTNGSAKIKDRQKHIGRANVESWLAVSESWERCQHVLRHSDPVPGVRSIMSGCWAESCTGRWRRIRLVRCLGVMTRNCSRAFNAAIRIRSLSSTTFTAAKSAALFWIRWSAAASQMTWRSRHFCELGTALGQGRPQPATLFPWLKSLATSCAADYLRNVGTLKR